jgi:hypothetical protein
MHPVNTPTQPNALDTVNWDDLLDTLDAEKCVLFLGEGAYEAPGGGSIDKARRRWLNADDPDHPQIRLYNDDGFLLFKKARFKRQVTAQIREFYHQSFPETEAVFSQIAALPFSMILTLTCDNLLARTFDTLGYPYHCDFYFRKRKAADVFERPGKRKPLLYNLLGNIEEPESIVLTHGDFFDYLESVFQGNSMHPELGEALESAERFIFLGLPYDKWYFQLLLRVFSLHSEKLKEVERMALREFENPSLHTLYQEEFKIEFFPCDVRFFVGELHRRCAAAGILKPQSPPDLQWAALPDLSRSEFQKLIADGHTPDALRHLQSFLERRKPRSLSLTNDLVVLRNRLNLLEQRQLRGTIYPQDANVENNQVVESALALIERSLELQ